MNEQMQRDIAAVERVLMQAFRLDSDVDAWLRIKASLSPDREVVAEGIYNHAAIPGDWAWELLDEQAKSNWLALADAAIAAMQGEKS